MLRAHFALGERARPVNVQKALVCRQRRLRLAQDPVVWAAGAEGVNWNCGTPPSFASAALKTLVPAASSRVARGHGGRRSGHHGALSPRLALADYFALAQVYRQPPAVTRNAPT